jgi:hypothetical protein
VVYIGMRTAAARLHWPERVFILSEAKAGSPHLAFEMWDLWESCHHIGCPILTKEGWDERKPKTTEAERSADPPNPPGQPVKLSAPASGATLPQSP